MQAVYDTCRLALDPLRPDHATAMFVGLADARGYAFIPDEPPPDVATLKARYAVLAHGRSRDGTETWLNWVIRRCMDGKLLGYTQATVTDADALIAYHVFPDQWGQGVGRKAVALMLDALFATGNVEHARALVDTRNTPSQRLLVRLGFAVVRHIEGADRFKGSISDEWELVLSRTRWLEARS